MVSNVDIENKQKYFQPSKFVDMIDASKGLPSSIALIFVSSSSKDVCAHNKRSFLMI